MVDLAGDGRANALRDLHDDYAQHDGHDHDVVLIALVAIANGDVANAARAHRAGHGHEAEQRDERNGQAAHQRRHAFGQKHLADDLPGARAKALRSFDEAAVDFGEALLNHARNEGRSRDGERHDSRAHAKRSAYDGTRERDHEHDKDDERNGTHDVHYPTKHAVEDAVRMQAARLGQNEQNAHRDANDVCEQRREHGHDDGVPRALSHKGAILSDECVDRLH